MGLMEEKHNKLVVVGAETNNKAASSRSRERASWKKIRLFTKKGEATRAQPTSVIIYANNKQ